MASLRSSVTFLHLSDLKLPHAAVGHRTLTEALKQLREDIDRTLAIDPGAAPGFLVFSGDLTAQGKASEFEQVRQFIEGLVGLLGIPRKAVVVLPGSRDINRKACEAYFNQCEADERVPQPPYWPKLVPFAAFFSRLYEGLPELTFTEAAPYTVFELPEHHCVVAALNSTLALTHREADQYGLLGDEQLQTLAERLRPYRERGWLRLAAVNHDYSRAEGVRDAQALRRVLGPYLNLLLIGQAADPQLAWLTPDLPALRTASGGLGYQLVRVERERIVLTTRRLHEGGWLDAGGLASGPSTTTCFMASAEATFQSAESAQDEAAEAALAAAVAVYRKRLVEQCQRQTLEELATHGEDREIPQGLALLDIFVPQQVAPQLPACDLPGSALAALTPAPLLSDALGDAGPDATALTVEDAVTQSEWVVILGAPGAGKSALTRWLCLKLCAPGETLPGLSIELVPVRIEARDLARRVQAAGAGLDFFAYLDASHGERMLPLRGPLLRELHKRGRLLFLLDGLDEIGDPQLRLRCAEMLAQLKDTGPARAVITSRIVGADQVAARLQQAGVAAFTLLDFDRARIERFVRTWYERACTLMGKPEEAEARSRVLLNALNESTPLAELCGRPLLLTLLALLGRSGELPRQRHHLYQRAVDLLAEEWHPAPHSNLGLDRTGKLQYLRALAFHMLNDLPNPDGNAIPEDELRRFTEEFLTRRSPGEKSTVPARVDALIEQLRARNQVLALVGGDSYGFVHRALLEYLAADYVRAQFAAHYWTVEELEIGIAKHWSIEAWREPLLLLFGMLGEDRPELVVRALQRIATQPGLVDIGELDYFSFALSGMGELGETYHAISEEFAKHLIGLVQNALAKRKIDFVGYYLELERALRRFAPRWLRYTGWAQWAHEVLSAQTARPTDSARAMIVVLSVRSADAGRRVEELRSLLNQETRFQVITAGVGAAIAATPDPQELLRSDKALPPLTRAVLLALAGGAVLDWPSVVRQLEELREQFSDDPQLAQVLQLVHIFFGPAIPNRQEAVVKFFEQNRNLDLFFLFSKLLYKRKKEERAKLLAASLFSLAEEPLSKLSEMGLPVEKTNLFIKLIGNLVLKDAALFYRVLRTLGLWNSREQVQSDQFKLLPEHDQEILLEIQNDATEHQRLLGWELLADAYGTTRTAYRRLRELAEEASDPGVKEQAAVSVETLARLYALSRIGKPARRRAEVRLSGQPVGLLEETELGSRFFYDPAYVLSPEAIPLSPTLPLRPEPFESVGLHPFFDNLLPEGWLLDLASQRHHLDRSDAFGLLLHTGSECVGAAEVYALAEDGP